MSEDTLPEIKKWVQFDESGNQIGTSSNSSQPEGENWYEIEEFSYGRHMILDNNIPRVMSDEEHDSWEASILISGAKSAVRDLRNAKLADSDWTEAAPLPEATKTLWKEYRQALRDLPENVVDYNVEWPIAPA
jgi:hypothetical protein